MGQVYYHYYCIELYVYSEKRKMVLLFVEPIDDHIILPFNIMDRFCFVLAEEICYSCFSFVTSLEISISR